MVMSETPEIVVGGVVTACFPSNPPKSGPQVFTKESIDPDTGFMQILAPFRAASAAAPASVYSQNLVLTRYFG